MNFLTLFQFLTRLVNSKHLKLFITYLGGRNGTMWKRAFQLLKMRKKKISWNIDQKRNWLYWQLGLRIWRIILVITWWAHKRQTFALISIKLCKFWNFLCTRNRVFKHKKVVSSLHVYSNELGKICPYIFNFSTRILNTTHKKVFNIFRIIYDAMTNNQFSALDNVKMTCQAHKY